MTEGGIEEVRARYAGRLLALPNVVGVALGERRGVAVIRVLVTGKAPPGELPADALVPDWLDGYPVDVEEAGEIQAEAKEEER